MVSIIMPVYNSSGYLSDAIESILSQTYSDFEFIIIDDASTDNSIEIIYSYHDPRIVLLKNDINLGVTHSLNKGIKHARGKYIARMDADDIALPQRIELQVDFLEKNPEFILVGSFFEVIPEKCFVRV